MPRIMALTLLRVAKEIMEFVVINSAKGDKLTRSLADIICQCDKF